MAKRLFWMAVVLLLAPMLINIGHLVYEQGWLSVRTTLPAEFITQFKQQLDNVEATCTPNKTCLTESLKAVIDSNLFQSIQAVEGTDPTATDLVNAWNGYQSKREVAQRLAVLWKTPVSSQAAKIKVRGGLEKIQNDLRDDVKADNLKRLIKEKLADFENESGSTTLEPFIVVICCTSDLLKPDFSEPIWSASQASGLQTFLVFNQGGKGNVMQWERYEDLAALRGMDFKPDEGSLSAPFKETWKWLEGKKKPARVVFIWPSFTLPSSYDDGNAKPVNLGGQIMRVDILGVIGSNARAEFKKFFPTPVNGKYTGVSDCFEKEDTDELRKHLERWKRGEE